ncbi:MAG: SUKH-3 domain-containing protein [Planctomycetales bacterium]
MREISSELRNLLTTVGFHDFRLLGVNASQWIEQLTPEYSCFPAADIALRSFGGLTVNVSGPGENVVRSDFELDPTDGIGAGDYYRDHEEIVGGKLYPLGCCSREVDSLVVDDSGRAYCFNDAGVFRFASTEELIMGLILGRRGELIWPLRADNE